MRSYDVVIVGGGIHGVGVAQAAAAAGHSVLVLEKRALAAGTSSRSSKLIHGGLRYLETAQIRLVFESLAERSLLLKLAPELVELKRFYLPVYPETRRRPTHLVAGLGLYAVLARFGPGSSFGFLPKRRWDTLDGLTTERLQKVFYYHDAQTDDARLTRAVMASAIRLGAELAAPGELISAEPDGEGCTVHYSHDGHEESVRARTLVNAAGPWVNRVLGRMTSQTTAELPQLDVELVQGTHIIVPGSVAAGIYYVESPRDGRAIFVMPWYGNVMVGTTERRHKALPDKAYPSTAERLYLLKILRRYFPRYADLGVEGLVDAWSGLRVLPIGEGHAFHRPRETTLLTHPAHATEAPRVLSIYGGKLTGYRATAEKVLARIAPALPTRPAVADTRKLVLTPADDQFDAQAPTGSPGDERPKGGGGA